MGADGPLIIYGAGGFAREVAWLAEACGSVGDTPSLACYVDDSARAWGIHLNGTLVMSLAEARQKYPRASCAIGIGSPRVRQQIDERVQSAGYVPITLIHPRVERSRWIETGPGTIICAGSILTTNIVIGRQVHINLDCTIGHDVAIGDYTTLAPGVHVSGFVHIGQRVSVGTGAVFINGTADRPLTIGDDAVIGAGACVIRNVEAGSVVGGVPAKLLTRSKP